MKQALFLLILLFPVLKSAAQLGRLPENPKILIYSIVATSGSLSLVAESISYLAKMVRTRQKIL